MDICGRCLHDKSAHEPFNHNNQLMYCGVCGSRGSNALCDMEEYNTIHKPSTLAQVSELQSKREFAEYKVKK